MALVHNGNLTNAWELRRALEQEGSLFHTTADSETIAYAIVRARLRCSSIEEAVRSATDTLEGAYSLVISSPSKLIAARDIQGFRPLCMGALPDGSTIFASESCALDAVGAAFVRDVEPGDIVCFKNSSRLKGILGYHFGIYVGKGYFIHASNSAGKVTAGKLSQYRKRFIGAVRIF